MARTYESRVTPSGIWGLRIALFSVSLAFATALLHRFFGMATPVALNLFGLAFAGAATSIVLAVVAGAMIWRKGVRGKFVSTLALLISGGMFAWPLSYLPIYLKLPVLHDVSTDTKVPPRFVELAKTRAAGANPLTFVKEHADRQLTAYPDIRSINVNRSSEEAFELAIEALRRQGLEIVSERAPVPRTGAPGWLEAGDRTLVVGFRDDVVVRVAGDRRRARLDVRSASRYGRHDLGRNAARVRRILKEFQGRLAVTVASEEERTGARRKRRTLKSRSARSQSRRSRVRRQ